MKRSTRRRASKPSVPPGGERLSVLVGLLFGSGLTALVFQVLWVKQLALVVGAEVYAVTIGVSAFFAGLALGGLLFGRRADRSARPLRLYAGLELGVATLAVVCTLALARAAPLFVRLVDTVGPLAWLMPFLLVGAPATAMGGTLPVLLRARRPEQAALGRASGRLYAANTAGAIVGALAGPFFLVPAFGVLGAAIAAGLLNLTLAGGALKLDREKRPQEATGEASPSTSEGEEVGPPSPEARWAIGLYALAGGVALGYEVAWSEAIVQFLSTRAHAFAVVLATYLLGLALGSAVYSRFDGAVRRPWRIFGGLVGAAGVTTLVTVALLGPWLVRIQSGIGDSVFDVTGSTTAEFLARFAMAALVVVLPTTTLLGAAFPVAVRLAAEAGTVGRDVGRVAALNTLGGIAGTCLTGFVLIPTLGLVRTLGLLAFVAALIAGSSWIRDAGGSRKSWVVAAAVAAAIGVAASLVPVDTLARLLEQKRGGELVFYDEGAGGTVAVLEQQATHSSFRRLYIQGVSNSGDAVTSTRYMRLQALLPLLVHRGDPRAALVIALGTGITCGSLLVVDGLEDRDCVELLPAVVDAASFFEGNYGVTESPLISLRVGDGRHDLLRGETSYDVITLEPPPPSARGVVNLYSSEFYELARDRLAPGGLIAQWWPLPTQSVDDSRSLVRSVLDVFPHVTVWSTEFHEALLLASMEPIELDAERIARRFERGRVREALAEVGVDSPGALLATWIAGREGLEAFVGNAPPVTDNRPRIEYAPWVEPDEILRILPEVLEMAEQVPLVGGNGNDRLELNRERAALHGFYRAALAQLRGDSETAIEGLRAVLREAPDNPYFNWFLARR